MPRRLPDSLTVRQPIEAMVGVDGVQVQKTTLEPDIVLDVLDYEPSDESVGIFDDGWFLRDVSGTEYVASNLFETDADLVETEDGNHEIRLIHGNVEFHYDD